MKTKTRLDGEPSGAIKEYDRHFELPPEPDRVGVQIDSLEDFHCRWPIGDPLTPKFRFCGDRKVFGKSYCIHHLDRAYTKMRPYVRRPREAPVLRLVRPEEFEPA